MSKSGLAYELFVENEEHTEYNVAISMEGIAQRKAYTKELNINVSCDCNSINDNFAC